MQVDAMESRSGHISPGGSATAHGDTYPQTGSSFRNDIAVCASVRRFYGRYRTDMILPTCHFGLQCSPLAGISDVAIDFFS
jgi:hypothetical protein